ncbi:nuclease-related domain-containing protein [Streptomyces sp. NPDC046977]|uniref:nuclease-related domain-containing protein n=1 Tax=Streptomyces sp. NPDC046977 TaxID=3154703 RepID=UPI0033ED04C0
MTAGQSAADHAAEIRAAAPWWRRFLSSLGWLELGDTSWDIGARGERLTAALLQPMTALGWHIHHDRAIPRSGANIDHLLITPDGLGAYVIDTKWWSAQNEVSVTRHGRLVHGTADRHRSVTTAIRTAHRVEEALGVPVRPVIAIYGAPVTGGRLTVDGVLIIPVGELVPLLEERAAKTRRAPGPARSLSLRAAREFPAYTRTH